MTAIYYDQITGREVIGNLLNKKNLSKYELDNWAMSKNDV